MLVLTESEAVEFLRDNGLPEPLPRLAEEKCHRELTTDVGRRCVYANVLTMHLVTEPDSVVCLEISDWAVWPSQQNMDLFYAYRRSLGEKRSLSEASFHVFQAHEANEFRNILHLGLISLFDLKAASTTTDFCFYASHDEYIDVSMYEGAPWKETITSWLGLAT